jgi:hypothetical protein
MARLGDRCIGLDAVLEERERYERFGFRAAYANIRFAVTADGELAAGGGVALPPASVLSEVPRALLEAYDRTCFPADRGRSLAGWTVMPNGRSLAVYEDGLLRGCGVIRVGPSGHKIAPLFADSALEATALYRALLAEVPSGSTVCLDVPEPNGPGVALAGSLGMSEAFRTLRMYRGREPGGALERIFGVTSFELG